MLQAHFNASIIPFISPSLRSMWLLKQLSGVVVRRRGFLRPVSIATHSSSWELLPTYPFCHTTNLSSSPWPIAGSELRWNGHWVDPLGLLLSLQPLREIKPTWVCFLSVRLSIGLPASPIYLSISPFLWQECLQDHMLHHLFCYSISCNAFRAHLVCCVCRQLEWATCWL